MCSPKMELKVKKDERYFYISKTQFSQSGEKKKVVKIKKVQRKDENKKLS